MNTFIKWVGGKQKLYKNSLCELLPKDLKGGEYHYYEPFLGGGGFLFNFLADYKEYLRNVRVNDINQKLVYLHHCVQHYPNALTTALKELVNEFNVASDKLKFYQDIRWQFNHEDLDIITLSTYFIFLNKTCFNGLYRENKEGNFNVPFGKKEKLNINYDTITECSELLKNVVISVSERFDCGYLENQEVLKGENVFFYFDPPYVPLTQTSNFTSYNKEDFTLDKQTELRDLCNVINSNNHKFMVSNSNTEIVRDLYKGYNIIEVSANRNINSNPNKRQKITELVITNY